ncbi:unnamed protein product, partial [Pylaiella littoralis]
SDDAENQRKKQPVSASMLKPGRMLARSTSWPRTLRTISRTVFAGTQIVPCRWCLREGTPSSTGVSTGSVRFGRRSKVFLLQRT